MFQRRDKRFDVFTRFLEKNRRNTRKLEVLGQIVGFYNFFRNFYTQKTTKFNESGHKMAGTEMA